MLVGESGESGESILSEILSLWDAVLLLKPLVIFFINVGIEVD